MSRGFLINGSSMVYVKFGQHIPSTISNIPGIPGDSNKCELGLTSDQIRVSYKFNRKDINTDDFGPDIPANLIQYLSEMNISMTLIHFDPTVLNIVEGETAGGAVVAANGAIQPAGILNQAGTFIGYGSILASGNHFMSLNIVSPNANLPYRFRTATLGDPAETRPLGTEKSLVQLNWRAIPYGSPNQYGEVVSSGVTLWDRTLDT